MHELETEQRGLDDKLDMSIGRQKGSGENSWVFGLNN